MILLPVQENARTPVSGAEGGDDEPSVEQGEEEKHGARVSATPGIALAGSVWWSRPGTDVICVDLLSGTYDPTRRYLVLGTKGRQGNTALEGHDYLLNVSEDGNLLTGVSRHGQSSAHDPWVGIFQGTAVPEDNRYVQQKKSPTDGS